MLNDTQKKAIEVLKADIEYRNGFSSYPRLKLKNKTGITNEEISIIEKKGIIQQNDGINDIVIKYLGKWESTKKKMEKQD